MTTAWINRIGTAVPPHDIHADFVDYVATALPDGHARALFARMAGLADIEHRHAVFAAAPPPRDPVLDADGFYRRGAFPSTAARMARYQTEARALAGRAAAGLDLDCVTHLIVASCTGFGAPGLDIHLMHDLGLAETIHRTLVGFMGCYAAIPALRLASDIVRANAAARVLVVNVELSSLHLREDFASLPAMLGFLLFGDGASAALVTARPGGLALGAFRSRVVPDTQDLITWHIADDGFIMHLSGQVPNRIRRWLGRNRDWLLADAGPIAHWAVHAGGRTILDAVRDGLDLPPAALDASRAVLRDCGNISSATLMFVLERLMRAAPGAGLALAFGPGLSVESFRFKNTPPC